MVSGSTSSKRRTANINYLLILVRQRRRSLAVRITPCEALPGIRRWLIAIGQKSDYPLKPNGKRLVVDLARLRSYIHGARTILPVGRLVHCPIRIPTK